MITFKLLSKNDAESVCTSLFKILHSNMSVIAPTGNSFEEDLALWSAAFKMQLNDDARQVVLIYDNELIGYFQYSLKDKTFMMEDIQFAKAYQGTGVFRKLYSYLVRIVPSDMLYAEAYVSKQNEKSQNVCKHLGLKIIGENKNGLSYHLRGDYSEILKKYRSTGS